MPGADRRGGGHGIGRGKRVKASTACDGALGKPQTVKAPRQAGAVINIEITPHPCVIRPYPGRGNIVDSGRDSGRDSDWDSDWDLGRESGGD